MGIFSIPVSNYDTLVKYPRLTIPFDALTPIHKLDDISRVIELNGPLKPEDVSSVSEVGRDSMCEIARHPQHT